MCEPNYIQTNMPWFYKLNLNTQNLTAKTKKSWIPCSMNMSDAVGIGWRALFARALNLLPATRAQLVVGMWPTKPLRRNMARKLLIVCVMKKRKQQETMDKEGSTDRPVVKPSEDLPDCEEPWGLFLIYIYINIKLWSYIQYLYIMWSYVRTC